ncbi:MAG: GNAT family N-acetyltransferase [Thermodesulfobacteriota bacterium]
MRERMDTGRASGVTFHFEMPQEIPVARLEEIERLIRRGGAVGSSFVKENLHNAFLIGYAADALGEVIGTVTLKRQKAPYRRRLEAATGLDLEGYLERGYTSVAEAWRGCGIAGDLIAGLIRRSPGQKIYVTIRMNNRPALELTRKNGMMLAAVFRHDKTGHEIGLFVNR